MRKIILAILAFLGFPLFVLAQDNHADKIDVLYRNEVVINENLQKQIKALQKDSVDKI